MKGIIKIRNTLNTNKLNNFANPLNNSSYYKYLIKIYSSTIAKKSTIYNIYNLIN